MIRGRTGDDGSLDFYDDEAPATVVGAVTKDGITGAAGGAVTAADITDATATGRAVLTAASQAAARTAIGAGTSSTTGTVTSVNGQAPTSGAVTVGADDITTGVLPIGQVPTGTTATTVALGNHSHPGLTADQAAATASVRTLGTGAQQAAAGSHTHTATQTTATAITPGTATNVQGILGELAARLATAEAAITALQGA